MKYIDRWRGYIKENKDTNKIVKVMIINKNNEVLVLQRSKEVKKYSEYWDLPGGHIKENEDTAIAGNREAKEETNLDINLGEGDKFDILKRVTYYKTNYFKGNIILDKNEHTNYKWTNLEEIEELRFAPGTKERIKRGLSSENKESAS